MALEYSTALKNRLLGGGAGEDDLKSIFANGYIVIYNNSTVPSADSTSPGTVLAVIATKGATPGAGNGLDLASASGGTISKDSDTWGVAGDFNSGNADNAGALPATHFRLIPDNSYTGSAGVQTGAAADGASAIRIQGTCGGTASADLILAPAVPTDDAPLDIAGFTLYL
jgi:hypothetical protein